MCPVFKATAAHWPLIAIVCAAASTKHASAASAMSISCRDSMYAMVAAVLDRGELVFRVVYFTMLNQPILRLTPQTLDTVTQKERRGQKVCAQTSNKQNPEPCNNIPNSQTITQPQQLTHPCRSLQSSK